LDKGNRTVIDRMQPPNIVVYKNELSLSRNSQKNDYLRRPHGSNR
jgi:hypothetical protein